MTITREQIIALAMEAQLCDEYGGSYDGNLADILKFASLIERALRERLAQPHCDDCGGFDPECPLKQEPQQEPVAWNWMQEGTPCGPAYYGDPPDADIADLASRKGKTVRLLYTTPQGREWARLTDDDLEDIAVAADTGNLYDLRCAIEAKLKEKNA